MEEFKRREELVMFHSLDRKLYARLVCDLGFDFKVSMKILGFWNWLESCGYRDVIHKQLQQSDSILYILTKQALSCLHYLLTGREYNPFTSIESQTRFITNVIDNQFSHWFLIANRDLILDEISEFVDKVCFPAFEDIALKARMSQLYGPFNNYKNPPNISFSFLDLVKPPCSGNVYNIKSFSQGLHSIKERTVYVKYQLSAPISKAEIFEYFDGLCGAELTHIEENEWFTKVRFDHKESIEKVFGEDRVLNMCINGKQGLAKRFVTMKESIKNQHLWPPHQINCSSALIHNFFNTVPTDIQLHVRL